MKNFEKFLGIVFAAVLLFSMAACGDGDGNGGDNGGGGGVTTDAIKYSGVNVYDEDGKLITGTGYDEDYFDSFSSGNFTNPVCKIENGKLTVDLGLPGSVFPVSDFADGATISDNTAKGFYIEHFESSDFEIYYAKDPNNFVIFIYAEKQISISGTDNEGWNWSNVTIKKGWNMVLLNDGTIKNGTPNSDYMWVVVEK